MRSVRTSVSHENIVVLSDIRHEKSIALSPYGPVRAGLTTLQRTNEDHQLTELLNSLEKRVATLNSKSYTVLDTLVIATEGARVALLEHTEDAGTKICSDCGNDTVVEGESYCLECLENMID